MKIRMLIATADDNYAEHLSNQISIRYADVIEATVCTTEESLLQLPQGAGFDVALIDGPMMQNIDTGMIQLPLLLWSETEECTGVLSENVKIRKHQRISATVAEVLEHCAKLKAAESGADTEKARITAIWSPAGGVGKTTVALAIAAKKASEGKEALYISLEPFSSTEAYFGQSGKSISSVFEMLENRKGNVGALIRGIREYDRATGIAYLCRPDNYDDVNILSADEVRSLIDACACVAQELVIDMSCVCDMRTRVIFELADNILIVTDPAATTAIKLALFETQHDTYTQISEKITVVANKGAAADKQSENPVVSLPYIQSNDAVYIYKTLANYEL